MKGDDYLIRGGGGCQILFGQIIYFRHGLGQEIYFHVAWNQENLFSCKHGKPKSTEAITRNSNVIESSIILGTTKINHLLISSDSVYYYSFYGIILLSLKK